MKTGYLTGYPYPKPIFQRKLVNSKVKLTGPLKYG
jgi:hypothetical protein